LFLSSRTPQNLLDTNTGSRTHYFSCDVSDIDSVEKTYQAIKSSCGCPDFLINNAGIAKFNPIYKASWEEVETLISVNFKGIFNCTKAVLNDMLERKNGVIINISSVAAVEIFNNSAAYSASKAAALTFSRTLRQECRKEGIKIIDVILGATETDIWRKEVRIANAERMMKPSDVADAVVAVAELSLNPRMMLEEVSVRPQLGNL